LYVCSGFLNILVIGEILEVRFTLDVRKKVFYDNVGKALEQVDQRGGGCPALEDVQGQAGRQTLFIAVDLN